VNKLTVKDIEFKGKKVIIRVDFNVPLDDNLKITDDIRIQSVLPTITHILGEGPSKVILMSHLGRPKGEVNEAMRLAPAATRLEELLGEKVVMLKDCVGDDVKKEIDDGSQRVYLLENLRFHKEETKNDSDFAKNLATLADVYVNDAFGTAHRAHASTAGITEYLPSAAGFLLEKEINYLGKAVEDPERPFVVILGGAKVSDKILLIENLLPKADKILIGGGMAFTFLKAQGIGIGNSIVEQDKIDTAKALLKKAKKEKAELIITSDFVITKDFNSPETAKVADVIPDDWESVDIGPKTIKIFKEWKMEY